MTDLALSSSICRVPLRQTVQLRFADGDVLEGVKGTRLEDFIRHKTGAPFPALAALVGGNLRELSFAPLCDEDVVPLDISTSEGIRIYRRSLAFLLVAAVDELFPGTVIHIDYTVPFGGYFCAVRDRQPFSADELTRLEQHMRAIVERDDPITRVHCTPEEARRVFAERGETEKAELVDRRTQDLFKLYELRGRRDFFYGYMVPSTGYLACFGIVPYTDGFVLQYPRREHGSVLGTPQLSPMMTAVFREYGNWLHLLRIENVGQVNELIRAGRIKETILVSEALQERSIAQIAGRIAERIPATRVVLIAGPSSSGKTTFSKRLAIQLLAHGVRPFTLEMDRFFVNRDQTLRDQDGNHDFESIEALDLQLLSGNVNALLAGKETQLPHFDFITGTRRPGPLAKLGKDQIIIAEGIHGLNPQLVRDVPPEAVFRIYISALTQLNIDLHNRISTTDTRLLRRIVRDAAQRGWSADDTLSRWPAVRRGERENIFPYQENADAMFNSALVYELSALKPLAEPLLLQVRSESYNHIAALRLLAFLSLIEPVSTEFIPENSLLREFIDGSVFHDYLPGKELNW
jgi:uridine kinase